MSNSSRRTYGYVLYLVVGDIFSSEIFGRHATKNVSGTDIEDVHESNL